MKEKTKKETKKNVKKVVKKKTTKKVTQPTKVDKVTLDSTSKILLIISAFSIVFMIILAFCLASKTSNVTLEDKFMASLEKKKIDDYLYEITYNEYDYKVGDNTIKEKYDIKVGACSTVRNSSFFGRNFDWYYDDLAEFIIRVPATSERHASIGVAYSTLTSEEASKDEYNDKYKLVPFLTVDGVNDAGVAVSINVVPTGDAGYTTGTNPNGEDLVTLMIPRYILDNASSASNAINLLRERNIYTPLTDKMAQEFHFMIADKDNTYIVEFINNEMVVVEDKNIMTNFYMKDFNEKKLPVHAMGIERYNILKNNYEIGNTKDGMISLMKKVLYSQTYDFNMNPFWYSEFSGIYNGVDLTTANIGSKNLNGDLNKAGAYKTYLEAVQKAYANKTRNGVTWLTTHTSVYDLENKSLTVLSQETDTEYNFNLFK